MSDFILEALKECLVGGVVCYQLVLVAVSVYLVWSTNASISRSHGLPLTNQLTSWLILGLYSHTQLLLFVCVSQSTHVTLEMIPR